MSVFDGEMKIRVSAASGTEAVLKRELIALGYDPGGAVQGRVDFAGDMRDIARANVFLRTAGRVRVVLAEFHARTFDELYEGMRALRVKEIFPRDAAVAVSAKSAKSALWWRLLRVVSKSRLTWQPVPVKRLLQNRKVKNKRRSIRLKVRRPQP